VEQFLGKGIKRKLKRPWQGPYRITERIGENVYRVRTDRQRLAHPLFHVSHLMPYYGPLSYPSYEPNQQEVSLWGPLLYESELPHGTAELHYEENDEDEEFDVPYEDPPVSLDRIPARDPTVEEEGVIGKAFIDDDGAVYSPFLLAWDPEFEIIMAHCKRVRFPGMTIKDCEKTEYYTYPEVRQLIDLHPYTEDYEEH
jgi:hypothetical protein